MTPKGLDLDAVANQKRYCMGGLNQGEARQFMHPCHVANVGFGAKPQGLFFWCAKRHPSVLDLSNV